MLRCSTDIYLILQDTTTHTFHWHLPCCPQTSWMHQSKAGNLTSTRRGKMTHSSSFKRSFSKTSNPKLCGRTSSLTSFGMRGKYSLCYLHVVPLVLRFVSKDTRTVTWIPLKKFAYCLLHINAIECHSISERHSRGIHLMARGHQWSSRIGCFPPRWRGWRQSFSEHAPTQLWG